MIKTTARNKVDTLFTFLVSDKEKGVRKEDTY